MTDTQDFLPALKREWLTTRIVLIAGFVLAVAAAVYLAYAARQQIVAARARGAAQIQAQQANAAMIAAFCPATLDAVKALGVLPGYTQLAADPLHATKTTGRYACVATTGAAAYVVLADLACGNLKSAKCLSIYAVVQGAKGKGTVLYKRR